MVILSQRKNRINSNKMCDDNGKPFITTLYNLRFAQDLCHQLFSIIMLLNSGHIWLFRKGFCVVFFSYNEHNRVKLPHNAHRKHTFFLKAEEKSKSQKQIPKRKYYLGLLHQILGHGPTRSLLAGYTINVW